MLTHFRKFWIHLIRVIKVKKVKLLTVVQSDQKAPFLIATTPRCRGGRYFFFLDFSTLPLICTLCCSVLSKKVSSTIFKVFVMRRPEIEPTSFGQLANIRVIVMDNSWKGCSPKSWFGNHFRRRKTLTTNQLLSALTDLEHVVIGFGIYMFQDLGRYVFCLKKNLSVYLMHYISPDIFCGDCKNPIIV